MSDIDRGFAATMLGEAVLRLWGNLPVRIQEEIFNASVHDQEASRTKLAQFLHDVHPRTLGRSVAS
ncbi:MAG: hypothetical protein J0G28_14155 [Afipia sp.]|nr:hypothetical protein [Afipia sp.]OJW65444.1 MAG: hypothetical protein BGO65_11985 [Afipia sp. 64-13]